MRYELVKKLSSMNSDCLFIFLYQDFTLKHQYFFTECNERRIMKPSSCFLPSQQRMQTRIPPAENLNSIDIALIGGRSSSGFLPCG